MLHRLRHPRRPALIAPAVVVILVGVGLAPVSASPAPLFTTVVDHLRNPRGIDFDANGTLYVAEAGQGGGVCFTGITTEEGGPLCAGLSGRVSSVDVTAGTRSDYVTGLVSVGGPLFAIGASGLGVQGNQVYSVFGGNGREVPSASMCGGGAACTDLVNAAQAQLGHLLRALPNASVSWRQDVGAFDYDWVVANKDTIGAGSGIPGYQPGWSTNSGYAPGDANPYALATTPGGVYSVDGGANVLTFTPQVGTPRVVAAFPDPPVGGPHPEDAVPTCVTPTAQGVVVADLNGRVFVVDGNGTNQVLAPSAVTHDHGAFFVGAGGCANDGKGNVYISDIFGGGVVKLALATMTLSWVLPFGSLNFPSGVAVGRDGMVYVANNGVCPAFPTGGPCAGVTGSIVRFPG